MSTSARFPNVVYTHTVPIHQAASVVPVEKDFMVMDLTAQVNLFSFHWNIMVYRCTVTNRSNVKLTAMVHKMSKT